MHMQLDQILDPQNSKRPKNPADSYEEPGAKTERQEQKQSTAHTPCTQHHQGGGQTTQATPTLTPFKKQACPTIRERANKGNGRLFSLPTAAAGVPGKPCLNFLSGL